MAHLDLDNDRLLASDANVFRGFGLTLWLTPEETRTACSPTWPWMDVPCDTAGLVDEWFLLTDLGKQQRYEDW